MLNRTRTQIAWTALFVAALMFSGVADAQLSKDEQKCVNTSNKNAQKIADAQGKNYSSCIKDFAKGKNGSADVCTAADAKGKLSKANSKYDSKTAKDCTMGSGFMIIADDATVKAAAKDKELAILEMIFGTDGGVDGAIIPEATDKTDSKCQQAIVKAVFKCQATKWKEYNSCKKNKIKGKDTTQATSASEVQDECTGTGAGSIPDNKGKIAKKCDFSSTISKKCPNNVFPGCPGDNTALNACLDAFVECKWCLANNVIDGLVRNCDEFDNGVEDGSCDVGGLSCQHDIDAFCVGGSNNTLPCTDVFGSSDCPPGSPTGRCTPTSFASLESISVPDGLNFALIGGSTFAVGDVDPNGRASMACGLTQPIGLVIPALLVACLTEVGGCDPGVIDCDGGTALDLSTVHHHSIDKLLLDPNNPLNADWVAADPNFVGIDCRGSDTACFTTNDPNCTANETCSAMCDVYCGSLSGNFTQSDSGCEGFCRGGTTDRELCTLDTECQQGGIANSGDCIGGNPVSHAGRCTCDCLEVGSAGPSPAGSFWCQVGLQTVTEALTGTLCDGNDIITVIGQQCVVRTTESMTNQVLYAEDDKDNTINQFDQGSRISCVDLLARNMTGLAQAGNQTSYDGDLGDSATRTVQECE